MAHQLPNMNYEMTDIRCNSVKREGKKFRALEIKNSTK